MAFKDCDHLTEMHIIGSNVIIESSAFRDCERLDCVRFESGVIGIGPYSFADCVSLRRVWISDTVTSIEQNAFYNCSLLGQISVPVSLLSDNKVIQVILDTPETVYGFRKIKFCATVADSQFSSRVGVSDDVVLFITGDWTITSRNSDSSSEVLLYNGKDLDEVLWNTMDINDGQYDLAMILKTDQGDVAFENTWSVIVDNANHETIPYAQWIEARAPFDKRNPASNPSGDGISNLLKYVFDLPIDKRCSWSDLIAFSINESDYELSYNLGEHITGVYVNVESSNDLVSWTPEDSCSQITRSVDDVTSNERISFSISRRFGRIVVRELSSY